jgi:nitrate/nitrite transporter NarK
MSRVFNNKSVTRYQCQEWTLLTLIPSYWFIVEHSWHWYLVTDLLLNTLDIDTGLLTYCWTLLTLIPGYWLIVEHSWHWYLVTDLLLNTLDIDTGSLTYCWTLLTLIPGHWLIVEHTWHWYLVTDLLLNSTISQCPCINVKSVQQ